VDDADGSCNVGAGPHADDLVAHDELGLALEDVEGVDVVGVAVRVDALEVRPEGQFDDLELGQLGEDAVMTMGAGDLLALTLPEEDPVDGASCTVRE
jgi:hypothetical protein